MEDCFRELELLILKQENCVKKKQESCKNKLNALLSAERAALIKMLVTLVSLTWPQFLIPVTGLKESLLAWTSQWIGTHTHNPLVRGGSRSLERQSRELHSRSVGISWGWTRTDRRCSFSSYSSEDLTGFAFVLVSKEKVPGTITIFEGGKTVFPASYS